MDIFEVVRKYTAAGLKVICVHSHLYKNRVKRGKAPSHYGWQKGEMTLAQLESEMQKTIEREGACNIGIITGQMSGLICIDVDDPSWFNEHEIHLGRPVIERTSNGKLHLWYKHPGGFLKSRSSGARLFKGVDILADGGNQVVTWPSIHSSGEPYVIDNGLDLTDALEEADVLPAWIVEEMKVNVVVEPRGEDKKGGSLDYYNAIAALSDFPPAIQGAGGDLTTLKAALLCRDMGLDQLQVYELLAKEYNKRCSPPWTAAELKSKVSNAFKYAKGTMGRLSIEGAFDDEPTVVEAPPALAYSKKHPGHNARIVAERSNGILRAFDSQFVLYDSDEHRWKVVSDAVIDAWVLKDMKLLMGQEFVDTIKVQLVSDTRKILKMEMDNSQGIPDVHFKGRQSGNYITVQNGILNVETGELEEHNPDWFSFHSLPMVYRDNAECPTFIAFLNDVWDGDSELIESLRLWMGYCLLTSCTFEKFAVFKGASRAGKSTLAAVIESIVGRDNTASTSLSLIGSDFGLQNLMGKKLCVFQDAERASLDRMGVATERIKSLSSNEPMGINRKGQTVVFQRMGIKIAFVCNRLPQFLNDESALTNRMIVFPFWKSFAGREDHNLKERLLSEVEGIFNWSLVGARRLLRGGKLFTAQKGLEEMQGIIEQLDSVQGFVAECLEITELDHNIVSAEDLWRAYKTWCQDSNRPAKNKQRFFMELHSHPKLGDRKVRTKTARGFKGMKLKLDMFPEDDEVIPF
jgi:putative DNA primase/helicase